MITTTDCQAVPQRSCVITTTYCQAVPQRSCVITTTDSQAVPQGGIVLVSLAGRKAGTDVDRQAGRHTVPCRTNPMPGWVETCSKGYTEKCTLRRKLSAQNQAKSHLYLQRLINENDSGDKYDDDWT